MRRSGLDVFPSLALTILVLVFSGCGGDGDVVDDEGNGQTKDGGTTSTTTGGTSRTEKINPELDRKFHETLGRAETLLADYRLNEARREFERARTIRGSDPDGMIAKYLRTIQQEIEAAKVNFGEYHYNMALQADDAQERIRLNSLAVVVFESSDTTDSQKVANAYNNRGVAYFDRRNYDLAIADFTTAIELDAGLSEVYLNRGVAKLQAELADAAVADFTKVLLDTQDDAKAAEVHRLRAVALLRSGQADRAVDDFTQAIAKNPKEAEHYYGRGTAYLKAGKLDLAERDLARAVELNGDLVEAHYNLGCARLRAKNYKDAKQDFSRAVTLKPDHARALFHRGTAAFLGESFQDAISDFTRVVKLDPDIVEAYYSLGQAYLKAGDQGKASLSFRDYLKREKRGERAEWAELYLDRQGL